MSDKIATVDYQVATYKGSIDVMVQENDDHDHIIAKARALVIRRSSGSLPMGYESWQVTNISDY